MMTRNPFLVTTRVLALGGLMALLPACGKVTGPTAGPRAEEGGMVSFRALLIDGHLYPSDQFHLAPADRCDDFHWHKPSGQAVSIGTPGAGNTVVCAGASAQKRSDPDPGGCGFGRISERPSTEWRTTEACYQAWRRAEFDAR